MSHLSHKTHVFSHTHVKIIITHALEAQNMLVTLPSILARLPSDDTNLPVEGMPYRTMLTFCVFEVFSSDHLMELNEKLEAMPPSQRLLDEDDGMGDTALCLALRLKKWSLAHILVCLGASVRKHCKRMDMTPLQAACYCVAPLALLREMCKRLEETELMVDTETHAAPLHLLASTNERSHLRCKMVNVLLTAGVTPGAQSKGTTALHLAIRSCQDAMVNTLLRWRCTPLLLDSNGVSAFSVASQDNNMCFEQLVGWMINAIRFRELTHHEQTEWMYACATDLPHIAEALLMCAFACIHFGRFGQLRTFLWIADKYNMARSFNCVALLTPRRLKDVSTPFWISWLRDIQSELLPRAKSSNNMMHYYCVRGMTFEALCLLYYVFDHDANSNPHPDSPRHVARLFDLEAIGSMRFYALHACAQLGKHSLVRHLADPYIVRDPFRSVSLLARARASGCTRTVTELVRHGAV